eukprot:1936440-Prymnesium_polylepis.3
MIGERAVARNATVVVNEVLNTALPVCSYVTTMRDSNESRMTASFSEWRQASWKTKMSSAPTPSTTKSASTWKLPNQLMRQTVKKNMASGKERRISRMPRPPSANDPEWMPRYVATKRMAAITASRSSLIRRENSFWKLASA